jgi:FkbM family methyltransferase
MIQGSLLAHPSMVAWRNRLRGNSFLRGLYRLWAGRDSYEERFGQGLLAAIGPGDVVWDIGANVGLYSEKFLERGARTVVCFEPAPEAIRALTRRFAEAPLQERVRVIPAALSNARGVARFVADGASPVNRLGDAGTAGAIDVPVLRGDEALTDYALPLPDVIKVDVEGFELEVIEGLDGVFERGAVRAVFVEVHFALLHDRGLDHAPAAIVRQLGRRGFRVTWLDASHLQATRAH